MDVLPARLRLPLLLGRLLSLRLLSLGLLSLGLPLLLSLGLPLLLSLRLPLLLSLRRLLSLGLPLLLLRGCSGGDSWGDPSAIRADCPAGGRLRERLAGGTLDAADYRRLTGDDEAVGGSQQGPDLPEALEARADGGEVVAAVHAGVLRVGPEPVEGHGLDLAPGCLDGGHQRTSWK